MLVKELIEELKKYPDYYPLTIFYAGCEWCGCGFIDEITHIGMSREWNIPVVKIEVE